MMVKGNNILHSVFDKCTHLMINNDELSENPILANILDQTQFISNLNSHIPLCSVVNYFENFLTSLNNWKQYAHKGISLEGEFLYCLILFWNVEGMK